MSRLVRKPKLPELDRGSDDFDGLLRPSATTKRTTGAVAGDTYLERMVKYIPGEIIGCFMIVNAILEQAMTSGGQGSVMAGLPVTTVAAGALVIALVLTPLFCWYVHEDDDAWMVNAAVSTIAFPFWAYLMGAVAFAGFHDGNLAAILILTFTVVSGLVAPVPDKPKAREQHDTVPKDGPRLVEALTA